MIQRTYGTKRPMNEAGGVMRRSVVLLASLLLVCVLMAGAVSADTITIDTSHSSVQSEIVDQTTYYYFTLNDTSLSSASEGDTIVFADSWKTNPSLYVTKTTGKFYSNSDYSEVYPVVEINVSKSLTFDFSNLPIDLSKAKKVSGVTSPNNGVGVFIHDSGSTDVTTTVKNLKVNGDSTYSSVSASAFFMNAGILALTNQMIVLDTVDTSHFKGSGGVGIHIQNAQTSKSDAGSTIVKSAVLKNIIATDNGGYGFFGRCIEHVDITTFSSKSNQAGTVTAGDVRGGHGIVLNGCGYGTLDGITVIDNENSGIDIDGGGYGNNYAGFTLKNVKVEYTEQKEPKVAGITLGEYLSNWSTIIVGENVVIQSKSKPSFKDWETSTVGSTVKDASGNKLLYPGFNTNGVAWTDNSDGWTLAISESGSYKLTDSFNLKSMTISAANVVIDGNKDAGVKVTLASDATSNPIKITGNTVTLKNLDVTATSGTAGANSNGVIQFTGTGGKLQNSKIDFSGITITDSFAAVRINGDNGNVSNSEIINGHSTDSSSQCIIVAGNNVEIQSNTLTPGKARATLKAGDEKTSSGSIAVRVTGSTPSKVTVQNNVITSTWSDTTRNSGVSLDTSTATPLMVIISDNTFTVNDANRTTADNKALGGYGTVLYINPSITTASVIATISGNTVKKGTYLIYADGNDGATSITITGTISGNDFAAITQKRTEHSTGVTTFTITGITWSNNIEPVVPNVPVEITGETVKVSEANAFTTDTTGAATITGEGANIVITPPEGGNPVSRDSTSGEVTIPDGSTIEAKYDDAPVSVPDTNLEGTTFSMILELGAVASDLPIPRPAFSEDVKNQVTGQNPSFEPAAMITAESTGATLKKVTLVFKIKKTWKSNADLSKFRLYHVGSSVTVIPCTTTEETGFYVVTATSNLGFSSYVAGYDPSTPVTPPVNPPQPAYSSGDGNMENAFRVLFETQGGSSVTPATGLSYGDKITAPANPVRDGYTFGGWYKDAACTQSWSFSDAIDGDMTLYAKWTGGSAVQQTTTATAQPTTKQTTAPVQTQSQGASATTAAPAATTAAGVSPTLTQAPAPVFGVLLGLLAAGVLLRRRE